MMLEVSSFFNPKTEIFGDVEIRSPMNDLAVEKEAFVKAIKCGNNPNLKLSEYQGSNRISTIVEAENESEALQLANEKFIIVLDLKKNVLALANMNMSKFGLIRNLASGEIKAISNSGLIQARVLMLNKSDIQRWDSINLILSKNSELSSRYIKSLHWAHNARNQANKQLKIIFNYFCLEALFKENENDNITSIIRCFIGFPSGSYYKDIDKKILKPLQDNTDYLVLNKKIPKYFNKIRKFRNDSVHSGFRAIDLNNEELRLYDNLLELAKTRCLQAVAYFLRNDEIETLSNFKNKAGHIFNKIVEADDILNNVVHSLNRYDGVDFRIIT